MGLHDQKRTRDHNGRTSAFICSPVRFSSGAMVQGGKRRTGAAGERRSETEPDRGCTYTRVELGNRRVHSRSRELPETAAGCRERVSAQRRDQTRHAWTTTDEAVASPLHVSALCSSCTNGCAARSPLQGLAASCVLLTTLGNGGANPPCQRSHPAATAFAAPTPLSGNSLERLCTGPCLRLRSSTLVYVHPRSGSVSLLLSPATPVLLPTFAPEENRTGEQMKADVCPLLSLVLF